MPRYHFNVYDGVTAIDKEGTQHANVAEARIEAMRFAARHLHEEAENGVLGEEWRVEVTDGRGMILFRIDVMMSASAAVG